MKYLEFECPNCGLVRKIPIHKGIYSLLINKEIRIVCNLCCYEEHWKLNILYGRIIKEKIEQKRFEKRYFKLHKKKKVK